MAPDQVFGRNEIEKIFKKRETILSPQEYHGILQQFGSLHVYGEHWSMFDFAQVAKDSLFKDKVTFPDVGTARISILQDRTECKSHLLRRPC